MAYLRLANTKEEAMIKMENVRSVHDYNAYVGQADEHPLVSVIDYNALPPIRHSLNHYSVFGLFLREDTLVDLTYGCGRYDYDETTLICVAPGQTGGKEDNGERVQLTGWALLFHPDLLRGTFLEKKLETYSFFSYNVNEALHMTVEERDTLVRYFRILKEELHGTDDAYKTNILVSLIDIVLQYCSRFYDRQFRACRPQNSDVLSRFERVLRQYYEERRARRDGLPTVSLCASELCLSTNYFADLVKRQTGLTASEHIRRFVVERAKSLLIAGESVGEVAYALGFEYAQHFSRFFKRVEGCTPTDYLAAVKS